MAVIKLSMRQLSILNGLRDLSNNSTLSHLIAFQALDQALRGRERCNEFKEVRETPRKNLEVS